MKWNADNDTCHRDGVQTLAVEPSTLAIKKSIKEHSWDTVNQILLSIPSNGLVLLQEDQNRF
jgi:hypothetical protein